VVKIAPLTRCHFLGLLKRNFAFSLAFLLGQTSFAPAASLP